MRVEHTSKECPGVGTYDCSDRIDIKLAFDRIIYEVSFLKHVAVDLDDKISVVISESASENILLFQKADVLRQSLEGLESFLSVLKETIGPDCRCSPSEGRAVLGLGGQVRRLCEGGIETDDDVASEVWI